MSTVLVVSLDSKLSDHWSVALEDAGHTVLAARKAGDGVNRLREGGIDVIVLGEQTERELAHLVAELGRLPDPPPFILVSGSPRAPEISAHLGAAAFVPQPCSPGEIVEAIARFSRLPASSGQMEAVEAPAVIEDEPTQPRRSPAPS